MMSISHFRVQHWWLLIFLMCMVKSSCNAVEDEQTVVPTKPPGFSTGSEKKQDAPDISTTQQPTQSPIHCVSQKRQDDKIKLELIPIGFLVAIIICALAFIIDTKSQKIEPANITPNIPVLDNSTLSTSFQGPKLQPESDVDYISAAQDNFTSENPINEEARTKQSPVATVTEGLGFDKVEAIGDAEFPATIREPGPPEKVIVKQSRAEATNNGQAPESDTERNRKLDKAEGILLHLMSISVTPINVMQLAAHFQVSLINRQKLERIFEKDPNSDILVYLTKVLRAIRSSHEDFNVEMLIEYWKSNNMRPLASHLEEQMGC